MMPEQDKEIVPRAYAEQDPPAQAAQIFQYLTHAQQHPHRVPAKQRHERSARKQNKAPTYF